MATASSEQSTNPNTSPNTGVQQFLLNTIMTALELGAIHEARADSAEQSLASEREAARIDPLTGLHNRRALIETYSDLQRGGQRRKQNGNNQPTSLLLMDLDKFKGINDSLGHDVGDQVLRTQSGVINARLRKRDLSARIGGEEFAILLPRTSVENALKIAEDIRKRTQGENRTTVSIGVTAVDIDESLAHNLKKADIALYMAKENGRNQVKEFSREMTAVRLALIANHGYLFGIED